MISIPAEHRRLLASARMPAEWEPHEATYLVWPHNLDTWPGKFETIPPVFAQIASTIAHFEPVRILINQAAHPGEIRAMIRNARSIDGSPIRSDRIELIEVGTNDSWIRDFGPIFVNLASSPGAAPIALDWRFNSWGGKYGPSELDDTAPQRLAKKYSFKVIEPGIVLEGGSIDVNGAGALLTTESCLLNTNRNAGLARNEIEEYLRVYLGARQILWLGEGIAGDDTDGHIDDLARFVAASTIVTVVEDDPADANYKPLRENLERLRSLRDVQGRAFRIETLPMPPAVFHDDTRLPASYANFYIVNGGVLMPSFDCASDAVAEATLSRLFAGRRIVPIPSRDLVWGLGAIHCLTQQHPAAYSG